MECTSLAEFYLEYGADLSPPNSGNPKDPLEKSPSFESPVEIDADGNIVLTSKSITINELSQPNLGLSLNQNLSQKSSTFQHSHNLLSTPLPLLNETPISKSKSPTSSLSTSPTQNHLTHFNVSRTMSSENSSPESITHDEINNKIKQLKSFATSNNQINQSSSKSMNSGFVTTFNSTGATSAGTSSHNFNNIIHHPQNEVLTNLSQIPKNQQIVNLKKINSSTSSLKRVSPGSVSSLMRNELTISLANQSNGVVGEETSQASTGIPVLGGNLSEKFANKLTKLPSNIINLPLISKSSKMYTQQTASDIDLNYIAQGRFGIKTSSAN